MDKNREEKRRRLREKMQNDVKDRDVKSGSSGKRLYDLKNYKDVKFFTVKKQEGRAKALVKLDIMPYIVSSKNHPDYAKLKKSGIDEDYLIELWTHTFIGVKKDSFLCLDKMYGKPCPICEEMKRLYENGDKKKAESLRPKHRVLYNVIDVLSDSKDIMLFETPYAFFQKIMLDELHDYAAENAEGFPILADIEEGYTVSCKGTECTYEGKKYFEYDSFTFQKRKAYPESILKRTIPLDAILNVPTYEEVAASFFGNDSEDDEEEEEKQAKEPEKKDDKHIAKKADDQEDQKKKHDREDVVKTSNTSDIVCEYGYVFGTDYDDHYECADCNNWRECKQKKNDMDDIPF